MKKRILFVDDQPMVLLGLERMLHSMRQEWDMVFASSGAEALAKMDEEPFDVVISDARMPGMNGAVLLREVMCRHPATVRLVLSGYGDRNLVAECVGVAHQYIPKPCDSEQLKSLIQNACQLSEHMVSPEVRRIVGSVEGLPNVPEVYLELREAMDREETGPQALGDILQKDAGMTAQLLKVVNSAFFGLPRTIFTPHEAVAFLGVEIIRMLVLTHHIFEKSGPLATRRFTIGDLWRHSLAVAGGARAITVSETPDRRIHEEAFIGGLLHDLGILVLAKNCPEACDRIMERAEREGVILSCAEEAEFGVSHSEIGTYLLGLWGIPSPILKIVSLHHRPGFVEEPGLSLLAVHASDWFVWEAKLHAVFGSGCFEASALQWAGFGDRVDRWRRCVLGSVAGGGDS